MNTLIISDLHLTENPNETYRWDIFKTARQFIKDHKISQLFILGDLLDKKDRHPAELINHLINELVECAQHAPVFILKGNHDYLKPEHPFLDFVNHLERITWIDQPSRMTIKRDNILWLPHTRTPELDWADLEYKDLDLVFMHQSVIGCKVSNMFEMNHGLNLSFLTTRTSAKIFSGDIHVPQDIGPLTYIGTQHPVSFGDDYQPRMVWLKEIDNWESIPVHTLQRLSLTVSSLDELQSLFKKKQLKAKDHVKVTVKLSTKELSQWADIKHAIKEWCAYKNVILFSITLEKAELVESEVVEIKQFRQTNPEDAFNTYCSQEQIDPYLVSVGRDLLQSAIKSH